MGIRARISEVRELCSDSWLWMRIWRTTPVLVWMKAAEAYRTSNYCKAEEYYRRGLSKYPSHPAHFSARYDLAFCLDKLGKYEEAIQELSYIVTLKHDLKDAYLMRARLLSYIGKYSVALETLRIASQVFPHDLIILSNQLHLAVDIGVNFEEIESLYIALQKQLKVEIFSQGNARVPAMTAIAHYQSVFGDQIKSDQMILKIFAEGNASLRANLLKGQRLLSNNRVLQAREHFRNAHLLDPMDPIPQILIAETYILSGEKDELIWAIQLAESACRASKWTNPDAIETLINAYQLNSELSKAEIFTERLKNIGNSRPILGTRKLVGNSFVK